MPWYQKPEEYVCDDCGQHFYNRAEAPKVTPTGYASSPVTSKTNGVTRCAACMKLRNRHYSSNSEMLGKSLGLMIVYKIRNQGSYTFLGTKTKMASMLGDTATAMAASSALGRMEHPSYAGGTIRAPGHYSGANERHDAMADWPANGMGRHHVHVGTGVNNRVLFGWTAKAYPSPNEEWCQVVTLYIGS